MRHLEALQFLGYHADGLAAARENGIGHHPHQADAARAVDERDPAPGKRRAQAAGGLGMGRVPARLRAAEDAKGRDRRHRRS